MTRHRAQPSAGFTLVELLVVVTIISVLMALLLPAIQAAREAARRSSCQSNLKQLGLGLQNYHSQYGLLPPGMRMHSMAGRPSTPWRVLVLPFIEEQDLHDRIDPIEAHSDSSYGGMRDQSARQISVPLLLCPSAEPPDSIDKVSHYAGVTGTPGEGESWDLDDRITGDVQLNGVLYPESRIRLGAISDGTSHTLAVGERTYLFNHWLVGATWRDASSNGEPPNQVSLASAKNVVYPINADHNQFGYYVSDRNAPAGAERKMLLNDLEFGSRHPGGAHFALADGSVQFLADSIDITIYYAMSTRDGGEVEP